MPTSAQKSALNVVFGAMTFGAEGVEHARVHTVEACNEILDIFQKHGHDEVDTARVYGEGTSEQILGDLDWQKRGLVMETKLYPTINWGVEDAISHKPEDLRKHLLESLKALKSDKVDMWYLHAPDRRTPFEDTFATVNDLYKEGHFRRFGISNYMAWEVARICEMCDRNGWIKPTVYQGIYNAVHRSVEAELFPTLRHYKISFYAYNPLAGGYLTSRYHRDDKEDSHEKGSRFDASKNQGKMYRARYWNEPYFDALDILRPIAKKNGLTEAECALRWMNHHSQLKRESNDSVIIGASSTNHIEQNLVDLEKGSLPEEVVKALDDGWERVRGISGKYWH